MQSNLVITNKIIIKMNNNDLCNHCDTQAACVLYLLTNAIFGWKGVANFGVLGFHFFCVTVQLNIVVIRVSWGDSLTGEPRNKGRLRLNAVFFPLTVIL